MLGLFFLFVQIFMITSLDASQSIARRMIKHTSEYYGVWEACVSMCIKIDENISCELTIENYREMSLFRNGKSQQKR